MKKTLGGDRLGSGKKMQVELHGYERSTHDMGYLWRSTMSAGTLVPFMVELALPGDTFDINLDADIKTHPTVGPLFGSYKVQLDVFHCPIRLYQAQLHNNKLKIGLNMAAVKLPQMKLYIDPDATIDETDPDNSQINPSSLLSYLNIRGVGTIDPDETDLVEREFNGLSLLSYYDIYKNYYANKQEEIGFIIHQPQFALVQTIDDIDVGGAVLPVAPATSAILVSSPTDSVINFTGATPDLTQIIFNTSIGQITAAAIALNIVIGAGTIDFVWNTFSTGTVTIYNWQYINNSSLPISAPQLWAFDLADIDSMREEILGDVANTAAFDINATGLSPYIKILDWGADDLTPYKSTQEGLAIKTYQSDLFNNWLSTEWIDGVGGINDITAIDTSGGSFSIDTLNLSKKVYDMLNRIAVSGGSYDDWLDAVYTHDRYVRTETPVYHGGLIKELVFQEVVSNSEAQTGENTQPLGTLGGKGIMAKKHKGGSVTIKIDEPSYIIGLISLTPRIDYSQGNKWDVHLKTMDDLHKPALDEIGFQELTTEQMAWWTTHKVIGANPFIQKSAGKQPAWINYMTNVNQTRGNFAVNNNEMFMTLNRRYEAENGAAGTGIVNLKDLTTYIDPSKFNQSFAQTSIDAQNFWCQIAVDITARRKMSAKLMPNL